MRRLKDGRAGPAAAGEDMAATHKRGSKTAITSGNKSIGFRGRKSQTFHVDESFPAHYIGFIGARIEPGTQDTARFDFVQPHYIHSVVSTCLSVNNNAPIGIVLALY